MYLLSIWKLLEIVLSQMSGNQEKDRRNEAGDPEEE